MKNKIAGLAVNKPVRIKDNSNGAVLDGTITLVKDTRVEVYIKRFNSTMSFAKDGKTALERFELL